MRSFLSNQIRSSKAIKIRYVLIIVAILQGLSELVDYYLCGQLAIWGLTPSLEQAYDFNFLVQGVVALAYLIILIIGAVRYYRWYARAYDNLQALGIELKYQSLWVIFGWIIPVVSFFIPYKLLADLHRKIAEVLRLNGIEAEYNINYCLAWWIFFLAGNVLDRAYTKFYANAVTIEEFQLASLVAFIGTLVSILTMVLSIKVIKTYSKMEKALEEGIQSGRIKTLNNIKQLHNE